MQLYTVSNMPVIPALLFTCLVTFCSIFSASLRAAEVSAFTFPDKQTELPLVLHHSDPLMVWAARDFASNIGKLTGVRITLNGQEPFSGPAITVSIEPDHPMLSALDSRPHGRWEGFSVFVEGAILHIIGADVRGAAYGLMTVQEQLGISPWQWWADVEPKTIPATGGPMKITGLPWLESPAVKYRGVFLNDEDWGLLPWASKTFEPEVGNIGPRSYEKIFQLLLRLKANTLWPAMHPGTNAFFTVDGNKAMAQRYYIHIGSSHAEPMLRNNVDEWRHSQRGEFDFVNNAERVKQYWQSRVEELADSPDMSMFTLGMRGIHDSHMQGASTTEESVGVLQRVIRDQRQMLRDAFGDVSVKQVFTPYKEVLTLYDAGLSVPEDVTLVWPDDNYGYIRCRSNSDEQRRAGGSGVYYHLSYWGRPHDYLWLSSTHPALIQFEMARAYADGADQLWIANVGDIKPIEYNMEWFLHLGWAGPDEKSSRVKAYLIRQFGRDFGEELAAPLARLMLEYYHLAFIRRPEFMGWSQTEPTTQTSLTTLTELEIKQRLVDYDELEKALGRLKHQVPAHLQSAWFQLVAYPVKGAADMNRKWLYRHLASMAGSTQQATYLAESNNAYERIQYLTRLYNTHNNGKWRFMMDASPRRLPVFNKAELISPTRQKSDKRDNELKLILKAKTAPKEVWWQTVSELGYSRQALSLYPVATREFEHAQPSLTYQFSLEKNGSVLIDIATLPTHANDFGHKLTVSLNGELIQQIPLNTKGRSDQWKQGVLANRRSTRLTLETLPAGVYQLNIAVNQTGIVIDEVTAGLIAN